MWLMLFGNFLHYYQHFAKLLNYFIDDGMFR